MIVKTRKREYKVHLFYIFIIFLTSLKITLMTLFSSDYQNMMFIPFVKTYVQNIGNHYNVYNYYYQNHLLSSFPYPPLMLYILSVGGGIICILKETNIFITNFIFKLPLLAFDFLGMFYIMKIFPNKRKYVGVLYFASPIIIYSGYMHGQLDIIPTTFLIIAIYYLTCQSKYKDILSICALSAAVACKLHILAVLPLIYIFYYKKEGTWKAVKHFLCTIILSILIILPFMGSGFLNTVIFNKEQTILTQVFFKYIDIKVYLPVLAVLIIYLKALNLSKINKELFISFCGVLFAAFLALIPPMPGWYTWIVPFITMFFINIKDNKFISSVIYCALNGLYLLYFIFLHNGGRVDLYFCEYNMSFLKIDNGFFKDSVFTILVGTLLYTVYLMYKLGINSNSLYKRRNLPFTIGISGDSGSGKSTLLDVLEECLGLTNILFVEGDGDHKWERGEKMWDEYTHLNPKANYLYRQAQDISTLRTGTYVMRNEYDHETGKFTGEHKIRPKRFIILCGLHSLYLPQMRKNLDLKIYMDADENLRRFWKIKRDMEHRGYSKDSILEQIEARAEDAKKYILPQKRYADLVIQYFDENLNDYLNDDYKETISLKLTLSADINLEPMNWELQKYNIGIDYDYSEDLLKQIVIFSGDGLKNSYIPFDRLATLIIPQLDEITVQNLNERNNINGIIKMVLLELISYKMQGDK